MPVGVGVADAVVWPGGPAVAVLVLCIRLCTADAVSAPGAGAGSAAGTAENNILSVVLTEVLTTFKKPDRTCSC